MLKEDEEFLKNLFVDYTPQHVMRVLVKVAAQAADEASDNGLTEDLKHLSHFAQALEDITSGRPFLV